MVSFKDIFQSNFETFYVIHQDGTKSQIHLKKRYAAISLFAAISAYFSDAFNDNIMMGIITVESILMGFAFNVMIYIASQDALTSDISKFRESKIKAQNLNVLADEIFANLSYFITICLFCAVISILWISFKSGDDLILMAQAVVSYISKSPALLELANWVFLGINFIWKFLLFGTAIESVLSFNRLVRRVTYLFQERRKLLSSG